MSQINLDDLREIKEFEAILALHNEAKEYLQDFPWCVEIKEGWYATGIYEKIGVFLFNIVPKDESVDDFIWIIVGDLPSVYLDKSVLNANDALDNYCYLMLEWANNVLDGKSLDGCYPIEAEPTIQNAELLKSRVAFIKQNLIV